MKKVLLRLGELVCIVLLAVLITFVCLRDSVSTQPFEKVEKAVASANVIEGLAKRDALEVKKKLSLEGDDYTDFVCYSSDSVMDVRELMLFKLADSQGVRNVSSKIEEYVNEKIKIFEGYAPEESSMLSAHVLIVQKGYVLFYVGYEQEKVISAFSKSL